MGTRRTGRIGRSARAVTRWAERFESAAIPIAATLGGLGMAALAGSLVLAFLPVERRPFELSDPSVEVAAFTSLCVASLLGWTAMLEGERRLRATVGGPAAFLLFVLLPGAAWVAATAHDLTWVDVSAWPGAPWTLRVARWYGPALVVLGLARFLLLRLRPRTRLHVTRGAWSALLVAPYGLLLAVMVFGASAPRVADGMETTINALGGGAIALQLALAFLVGAPDS